MGDKESWMIVHLIVASLLMASTTGTHSRSNLSASKIELKASFSHLIFAPMALRLKRTI